MTSKILTIFLLTISLSAFSQTKSKTTKKPKLTYYYVGDGCPFCIEENTGEQFGLTIKCIGCQMTDTTKKHNESVMQQLDKKYGQGWTSNYIIAICDNVPINSEDKKVNSK